MNQEIEGLAKVIVDSAFYVHKTLGPGLLESVYASCLFAEFKHRNLNVEKEVRVPLKFRNYCFDEALRLDFLVDDWIIIELKAVEHVLPVHKAQILSYLRLTEKRLGFLINFNVPLIKEGIFRIAN